MPRGHCRTSSAEASGVRSRSRSRSDAMTGAKGIASPSTGRQSTDERVHVDGLEDLGHERRLADAELARYDGNLTVPVRCGEEHGTHTLALAVTSEE